MDDRREREDKHAFLDERVRLSVSEYRRNGNENYKGHLRRLSRFCALDSNRDSGVGSRLSVRLSTTEKGHLAFLGRNAQQDPSMRH